MGCASTKDIADCDDVNNEHARNCRGNFDDHYFTQKEKRIILDTWSKVNSQQVEKGIQIFLKIFELKPEAKQLFKFRDLYGDDLINDSTFRLHSKRFMAAIQNTVDHLDALDVSCAPTLIQLGKRHAWIKELKSARYMEAFIESVASVFENELPENSSKEVHDAWRKVFSFLVDKLSEGYDQATGFPPAAAQNSGHAINGANTQSIAQAQQQHDHSTSEGRMKSAINPSSDANHGSDANQANRAPSSLDVDRAVVPLKDIKTPGTDHSNHEMGNSRTARDEGETSDNIVVRINHDI